MQREKINNKDKDKKKIAMTARKKLQKQRQEATQ